MIWCRFPPACQSPRFGGSVPQKVGNAFPGPIDTIHPRVTLSAKLRERKILRKLTYFALRERKRRPAVGALPTVEQRGAPGIGLINKMCEFGSHQTLRTLGRISMNRTVVSGIAAFALTVGAALAMTETTAEAGHCGGGLFARLHAKSCGGGLFCSSCRRMRRRLVRSHPRPVTQHVLANRPVRSLRTGLCTGSGTLLRPPSQLLVTPAAVQWPPIAAAAVVQWPRAAAVDAVQWPRAAAVAVVQWPRAAAVAAVQWPRAAAVAAVQWPRAAAVAAVRSHPIVAVR